MRRSDPTDPSSSKAALGECLSSLGLPPGLLSPAYHNYLNCESRMWLLDNSSHMKKQDSHVGRSLGREGGTLGGSIVERVDRATRWEELKECVEFHAEMSSRCWIPTKFWLVNDPANSATGGQRQREPWERYSQKFNLCHGTPRDVPSEMNLIRHVMKNATLDQSPCPLSSCLRSLSRGLIKHGPDIAARGAHVTLVICTQGRPTDSVGKSDRHVLAKFGDELSALSKLPVRIIVRLCTDNEKVRDMYNTIDLESDCVDVLDDFWGESLEVYLHNPWLTYTMGLHRLRESGLAPKLMDELDTRPLCLDEIHQLCKLLFIGEDSGFNLPHPQENWCGFLIGLETLVENEKPQWNPIKKRPTPWINLRKLKAMHGGGKSSEYLRHSLHNGYSPKHAHTTHVPREEDGPRKHAHRNDPFHGHRNDAPKSKHRPSRESQDQPRRHHRHNEPQSHKQPHHRPSDNVPTADTATDTAAGGADRSLSLLEVLQKWSHKPPDYKRGHSLENILVSVPQTFPPTNEYVEPHEYFAKWKTFDREALNDCGDNKKELLKRAVRKAKFFLHPDKLPKDLTENQTLLFKSIWDVIQDLEAKELN